MLDLSLLSPSIVPLGSSSRAPVSHANQVDGQSEPLRYPDDRIADVSTCLPLHGALLPFFCILYGDVQNV